MKARRGVASGALAVVAMVAAACTGGGDIEVLVDDSTDPVVLLGEAVEATSQQSGRFTQTMTTEFSDLELPESDQHVEDVGQMEVVVAGEFDGFDLALSFEFRASDESESFGPVHGDVRVVDGRMYQSTAFILSLMADDDDLSGGAAGVESAPDLFGSELFDGRDWVGTSLRDPLLGGLVGLEGSGFAGWAYGSGGLLGVLSPVAEEVHDVVALDDGEIDGVAYRRVSTRWKGVDGLRSSGLGLLAALEGNGDELARLERISAYHHEHEGLDLEVWIDNDGLVRRLIAESFSTVDPQYRECLLLVSSSARMSMQLDIFDIGADVDIVAPDPSDVASWDEQFLAGPLTDGPDGLGGSPDSVELPSLADLLTEYDVSEQERAELEAELAEHADLLGVDPASLPERNIEELVALLEQLVDEFEQLPTYDSPFGPMNEYSLRAMVEMGMSMEGVDPELAADLSPEQMVDLMEMYLSNPDNSAGLGAGGFGGDLFEGCPA